MKFIKILFLAAVLLPVFVSCSKDDETAQDVNVSGTWYYSDVNTDISVVGYSPEMLRGVIENAIAQIAPFAQGTALVFNTNGTVTIGNDTDVSASGRYEVTNGNQVYITIEQSNQINISEDKQVTVHYTATSTNNQLILALDKQNLSELADKLPWSEEAPINKETFKMILNLPVTTFNIQFLFTSTQK